MLGITLTVYTSNMVGIFFKDEGGPFDGFHFSETEKGGVPMD